MDLRNLKKTVMATAAVALMAFGAGTPADAQVTQQFTASFITAAALTTAPGTNLDFGTWAVSILDGETITVTIPPTLGGGAPGVPTPALTAAGGTGGQQSLFTNTVAPASSGTFTVTTPVNTTLQISGSVSTDFPEANVSMNNLMYDTATEGVTAVPGAFTGGTIVTTQTGGTPEEIAIGADLVISGTIPEATTFGPATVDINLQYGA